MFGGAPIGGLYAPVSDETAAGTLAAAWEAGIRGFDTAPHYGADGADRALGAEFGQRGVRLVRRLLHEVVGVVDEHDVHPVEPEPFQAFLQAAPHSVPAVVADPGQRRYVVKPLLALDVPGRRYEPPAHLGAHAELVPGRPARNEPSRRSDTSAPA
jgi:hypothetical protein